MISFLLINYYYYFYIFIFIFYIRAIGSLSKILEKVYLIFYNKNIQSVIWNFYALLRCWHQFGGARYISCVCEKLKTKTSGSYSLTLTEVGM